MAQFYYWRAEAEDRESPKISIIHNIGDDYCSVSDLKEKNMESLFEGNYALNVTRNH